MAQPIDFSDVDGNYRKPGAGMLRYAARYNLRPSQGLDIAREILRNSLMVGDRLEDEGAAIAAGTSFMWAEDWRHEQS